MPYCSRRFFRESCRMSQPSTAIEPAVHIVKPHEQIDERTLAAAGGAHDGDTLSGLHMKVQIPDQFPILCVGEGHILQVHLSFCFLYDRPSFRVRRHRLLVDKIKDPGRAGQRVLKLRHHAGDLVKGLGILIGIA